MTDADPDDPGLHSLTARRRQVALEGEISRLEAELATAHARLADSEQLVVSGKVTKHSQGTCRYHPRVVVDEEAPVVECADCGERLDPWKVLLELATSERHFRSWTEEHVRRKRELAEEVRKLGEMKTRLRTEIKRLLKEGGMPDRSAVMVMAKLEYARFVKDT